MAPIRTRKAQRKLNFEVKREETAPQSSKVTTEAISPKRKKQKLVQAVVTPEEVTEKEYIPKYIHQNVDYKRKGETELSEPTRKAFKLLVEHYELPKDLEQSRAYGPLSGSSYEQRALRAYTLGKLKAIEEDIDICTACGDEGHRRDECSTLV